MCGISGFVNLSDNFDHYEQFIDYFKKVNAAIVQRGPDCFGLYGQDVGEFDRIEKGNLDSIGWGTIYDNFFNPSYPPIKLALANFRGIPTTEFLAGGSNYDRIQPYHDEVISCVVTHNGQLSNDEDLNKKYNYQSFTGGKDIDSYYLIRVLQSGNIIPRLREVEGSYAVAAFSKVTSSLYFARSFLGLFFTIWKKDNDWYLVWSSERQSLKDDIYVNSIEEMPLNSFIELDYPLDFTTHANLQDIIDLAMQIKPNDAVKEQSCAVVLSGGMDSVTCLSVIAEQYQNIHLLHFKYGARAEQREIESVNAIYEWFRYRYPSKYLYLEFIDLDFIKKLGGSTLTDHSLQIARGEHAIETTHEWVPARNIAMIGLATSYCDRHNIGAIVLGLNREESGVYRDNSSEFYQRMEAALQIGSHSQPKLLMPMGNSMKHHIWRKARELNAPLHLSWSCYEGKEKRCGTCGPCSMRQRAAAMNGEIDDLVEYEERDPVAIQIFNKVRAN